MTSENELPGTEADQAPDRTKLDEIRLQETKVLLGRIMSGLSRLDTQVQFVSRQSMNDRHLTEERLTRLEQLVAGLYDALHLPMPEPRVPLVDAKVELLDEVPEGEVWEMQAAWSATAHPIFGHYQVVLVGEQGAQQLPIDNLDKVVTQRLIEAFKARQDAGTLVDGHFYPVKLMLITDRPVSADTKQLVREPAANDDAESSSPETTEA